MNGAAGGGNISGETTAQQRRKKRASATRLALEDDDDTDCRPIQPPNRKNSTTAASRKLPPMSPHSSATAAAATTTTSAAATTANASAQTPIRRNSAGSPMIKPSPSSSSSASASSSTSSSSIVPPPTAALRYNTTVQASNTIDARSERSPAKPKKRPPSPMVLLTANDIRSSAAVSAPIPYMNDNNSVPGRRYPRQSNSNHSKTQNNNKNSASEVPTMAPPIEHENEDDDENENENDSENVEDGEQDHSSSRSELGTITSEHTYDLVMTKRYLAYGTKPPSQPPRPSSQPHPPTASSNKGKKTYKPLQQQTKTNGTIGGYNKDNLDDDGKVPPPLNQEQNRRVPSDVVTQLLIDEKRRQAGGYINHDLDMYLYPDQTVEAFTAAAASGSGRNQFVNRNQHHRNTNDGSRDDETMSSFTENNSLSTAPEPPSLREYRGVFFKPGAYRIKEDGEARQADLDSCVSSIRTHSTLRTNRTNRGDGGDIEVVGVANGVPVEATVVADEEEYLVVHADPIPVENDEECDNSNGENNAYTSGETAPASHDSGNGCNDNERKTSNGLSGLRKAFCLCFRKQTEDVNE
mmetsp:Transcript_56706/g.137886  ORF Transcript_56706/g.137886 Transcript_56706/m.137886 type:complete len:580 (+) Transcript_56706:80-1819(+)